MNSKLYPIKFNPILKDKLWGGNNLKNILGKSTQINKLGESWELSGYEGDESIVVNGFLTGKNLIDLIDMYGEKLIGGNIYNQFGNSFPLLFKLIDANDNLSIQVHPNDEIAKRRCNSFGKTEMWYVVEAEAEAELIIGFSKDCSRSEYSNALAKGEVENLLQKVPVSKGDVFFIPAGLVHAIGKGIVVAEIQQSSDITYRIYDYKRKDDNGKERELHTEEALDVIDFTASPDPKTNYNLELNRVVPLVQCEYFTTNILHFNEEILRNYTNLNSFVVYMCVEGDFIIELNDERTIVNKGNTVLIPASITKLLLIPKDECKLLEVYVGES